MHICTVTVAIVHKCTNLHPLMWMFFWLKCIKRLPFFILQKFIQSDVIALNVLKAHTYQFCTICPKIFLNFDAQIYTTH